jgi:hypothetical protein
MLHPDAPHAAQSFELDSDWLIDPIDTIVAAEMQSQRTPGLPGGERRVNKSDQR